jgi:hypothetical protein
MQLHTLEREKSRADEAFARGALPDAAASLETIESTYLRLGFHEGLATLRYNRLLMAVEADERAALSRIGRALAETLRGVELPASPLLLQVAAGVRRLVSGTLRGLDPQTEEELADAALRVGGRTVEAEAATTSRDWPAAPPREVAGLHPEDAARVLLTRASGPLLAALGATGSPSSAALAALDVARAEEASGDREKLYVSLVRAFEASVSRSPQLAFEIQTGLTAFEAGPMPMSIDYLPQLPRERRLRLAAELHGRLAMVLSREAGSEATAIGQWQHAAHLAGEALELAAARRRRGAGHADDGEWEARLVVLLAETERALGNGAAGLRALETLVPRAQRAAFARRETSVRVLVGFAEFNEHLHDLERAAGAWADAAELAMPGVTSARRPMALAQLVGDALDEGAGDCVAWAALAMAGVARTRDAADPAQARLLLASAHTLLSFTRRDLEHGLFARSMLVVELTLARFGDAVAAGRARELARAQHDPEALVLAGLWQTLPSLASESAQARRAARLALLQVSAEAVRAASGAVRRAAELFAAHACCSTSREEPADWARVEVHLRRHAEACGPHSVPDGAGAWDLFVPTEPRVSVNQLLLGLLEEGRVAVAHRTVVAERRRARRPRPTPVDVDLRDRVREAHGRAWTERMLDPVHTPAVALEPLEAPTAAALPRPRALADDEALVEWRVLPNETWAFVRVGAQAVTHVRLEEGAARLQGRVTDLVRALRGTDEHRRDLLLRAQELHRVLLGPLASSLEGVRAVVMVPDGPLWNLPFGLLLGEQFLCERFELSVARWAPEHEVSAWPPASTDTRLVVVGDAVTSRDLRLCELEQDGAWSTVHVHADADALTPEVLRESLAHARCVHFVGALDANGVALVEARPVSVADLTKILREAGVGIALLHGPVEGPVGRDAIAELLSSGCDAVVARHWDADADGEFLHELARACARAEGPQGAARALSETRRAAIRARMPAQVWMAYEIYEREPL